MYDFSVSSGQSPDILYSDLTAAARAVTNGETDAIANMANISALIWQYIPDLNWAGFYRVIDNELVLGPFQGQVACIRIAMGKGVCGTAAATNEVHRVADVTAFPGHIACDTASRSELVVPVCKNGTVVAVLDLDSPLPNRFSSADENGLTALIAAIANKLG